MPKQKKMWDNILTVIMTLLSLLWIYPIVPVSYTHLDVYKRQISTRIFEKADKPFQNHATPGRLCYLPGIAFFLSPFIKPLLYVEKLQIGTVLPVVSD